VQRLGWTHNIATLSVLPKPAPEADTVDGRQIDLKKLAEFVVFLEREALKE
jgi:hypothetical protein